ncbi:hypothetical protein [Planctomyces sp. SH-PL62]|uniref:hypothetical protein n=1 Tax=Planctomyces sp. SH-PL62 TaxID=1636152 RepID=UPI00078E4643|nr:hypothetical protein [Planctomyces sp. SH-PL62]AMV40717.1 hypothetical protein VT85_25015 [Planctomyces sp. SH-PL62]
MLGLIVALLILTPSSLSVWWWATGIQAPGGESDSTSAMTDGYQKTVVVLVVALAIAAFGRFVPVLWSLCQSSLSGLLIAAQVGLVYWIIYGGLSGVGMPGLFWHFDPSVRLRAAVGATLFTYWMLYLLFLRDYEVHRRDPENQSWPRFFEELKSAGLPVQLIARASQADPIGRLQWVLAVAGLPALLALALPATIPALRPGAGLALAANAGPAVVDWAWLGGIAIGAAVTAVLAYSRAATRVHEAWRVVTRRAPFGSAWRVERDRLDPHANMKNLVIVLTVVFVLSYYDEASSRWLFPAAFSMCIVLGVLATALTWLGTRSWGVRLAVGLTLFALLAAGGALDYEVRLRGFEDLYPSSFQQYRRRLASVESKPPWYHGVKDLQEAQRAEPPGDAAEQAAQERRTELLERWRDSFGGPTGPTEGRRPILVVVATSGGASRAAAWTESVLGHLAGAMDDFRHHVRLITGASGGMLGAARFITSPGRGRGMPGGPHGDPDALTIPPDYLTPIAWQIAFRDFFPNALLPFAMPNRGDVLERAWAQIDRGIDRTFEDFRAEEEAGMIPSIVFSPMMSEDGRRLLISNLPLADLAFNDDRALLVEDRAKLEEAFREAQLKLPAADRREPDDYGLEYPSRASVSAVEFFRLFETHRDRLRLASAVRMSATFPYVTSSVVLPTYPPRHVVDAGYYDNYGVNLAGAWISTHAPWLARKTAGVLFIQIRAFPNEARLKKLDRNVLASPSQESMSIWRMCETALTAVPNVVGLAFGGLQALAIPFEGIAQARDSSMYFRNDAQLNGLHETFRRLTGDDHDFFRTVVFTCDTTPSDPTAPNVETLNWYLDPIEFRGIQRNMEDVSANRRTGRLRNHLRFEKLLEWWRSREKAAR